MLNRRAVILGLTIFASFALPNAWGIEEFPVSAHVAARRRIENFLNPDTLKTGVMGELRKLEVDGFSAVHLLLEASLQRISDPSATPGVLRRVRLLLEHAAEIARTSPQENANLKAEIERQAQQMLGRFRFRSGHQDSLISIYDSLALWSPQDFWFFMQFSKNTGLLLEHQTRIQRLIPTLSKDQLESFATRLREIRPYNVVQLSLLLDTGLMTERELTILFKAASYNFVKARTSNLDESTASWRWRQKRDRAVAPTLRKLSESLKQEKAEVVSAFNKARKSAEALPPSRETDIRKSFYIHFLNQRFEEPFSSSWRPENWPDFSAAELETPTPKNLPDYGVQDNVILVDFKYQPSCEDDLE